MSETRTMNPFEVVDSRSSANVIFHPLQEGEQSKVVVSAQENLLPHIQTVVQGKRLVIDIEGNVMSTKSMTVEVFAAGVTKFVNDGSGSFETAGTIRSTDFEAVQDGSGSMMLGFNGDNLEVGNDGSGSIRIIGKCREAELNNDGSGSINAAELECNIAEVASDGSGSVYVYAIDELSIELSGSGDVTYEGDPQNIETSNSGSGSIRKE